MPLSAIQNRFALIAARGQLVDLKRRRALLAALGGLPGKGLDAAIFDTQREIARLCRALGCGCKPHPSDQSIVFDQLPDCPVHS